MSVQCTLPVHRAVHEHLAISNKRSPAVCVQVSSESSLFLWFIFWLYASGRPHEFRIGELNAPGISVKQLLLIYLQYSDISDSAACLLGHRTSRHIPLGRQTDGSCQHCAERTTVRMRQRCAKFYKTV
jgi:hypothetical protein